MTTREKIIKAAFELISSKGYQGATTREIARVAGVAEVTLFRHFTNKETLFAEVLRSFSSMSTLAELLPGLNEIEYEPGVRALMAVLVDKLVSVRDWIRIMGTEVGYVPEIPQKQYSAFMDGVFSSLAEYFEQAHDRKLLRPGIEPLYVARAFHSLIFGFFHVEGLLGGESDSVESYECMIAVFVDMFCNGTRG